MRVHTFSTVAFVAFTTVAFAAPSAEPEDRKRPGLPQLVSIDPAVMQSFQSKFSDPEYRASASARDAEEKKTRKKSKRAVPTTTDAAWATDPNWALHAYSGTPGVAAATAAPVVAPAQPTVTAVIPSSAPVAAPATGSTGGAGACEDPNVPCAGDVTYGDGDLGACGWNVNTYTDMQIALPHGLMGTQSNGNPYCGRSVTIRNPITGATARAHVGDKCMGCTGSSIDLTRALFNTIAADCDGRCSGWEWWFDGGETISPLGKRQDRQRRQDLGACRGEGAACVGEITHYEGGTGACGFDVNTNTQFAVSLPEAVFGNPANPNANPLCNQYVTIENPTSGVRAIARVADKCPKEGCPGTNIDLTLALFNYIAPGCDGRCVGFRWWFN
ncbi:hypothetical protein LTR64_000087 [Lithohypha guttulata]|uniref:uncharacterized protein n=1 Tax=Lithohypha guttulata TaxID=1690604 RepID=UPI002DDF9CC7|nr:hypothetical protein LTR51_007449 [Lithohypha guttulata]